MAAAHAGLHDSWRRAMLRRQRQPARYLLPLGTRCRALFQMDFAEALYICELRSAPQGHFSYRRVAWEMYRAVERQHPALAQLYTGDGCREPVDLLKR